MTSVIPIEGRALGGADGGLQILAPGISLPFADGRYIKRLVGATLAGDTVSQTVSSGAVEVALTNPNGAIQGALPLNASASLFDAGDGARIGVRARVVRIGNAPTFVGSRAAGTLQAPTALGSGLSVVSLAGNAYHGTGYSFLGSLALNTREIVSSTAAGSSWEFQLNDIGSVAVKAVFQMRGGGANVGEFRGMQTTTRFLPFTAGVIQCRNPLSTANVWESGTDDYALFGGARVTRRAAIANPAADVASLQTAVIAILDALRPTTGINLIAP